MKYIIGFLTLTGAFLVLHAYPAYAQNLNVTTDTTINVPSVGNFTLKSNSTANSMTADSSTVMFDMSNGQSITLLSSSGNNMTVSPSGVSATCVGTDSLTSQVQLAPTADTVYTVTPSVSLLCTSSVGGGSGSGSSGVSSGGGGGGGGGGAAAPAPVTTPAASAPKTTASAVVKTVEAAAGGSVEVLDKSAAVSIPVGAFTGKAEVSIMPTVTFASLPRMLGAVAGQAFEVGVKAGGASVKMFSKPLTLTFTYSDAMAKGLKQSTLQVQYYDDVLKKWIALGGKVDAVKKIITVEVNHLTLFAVTGDKETIAMAGDLIKLTCPASAESSHPCRSVYYLGQDLKRYVFPNEVTYRSWYTDFSGVIEVPQNELQSYPIRANVTMRPGTYLVKITTDPKTYAVEPGGVLRWVPSEEVATALYGMQWAKKIVDVADPFFVNYASANAIANPLKANEYPNGVVIAYANAPMAYYHLEGGKKRKFTSPQNMTLNGFRVEFAITAPSSMTLESGTDITAREDAIASIH